MPPNERDSFSCPMSSGIFLKMMFTTLHPVVVHAYVAHFVAVQLYSLDSSVFHLERSPSKQYAEA